MDLFVHIHFFQEPKSDNINHNPANGTTGQLMEPQLVEPLTK